MRHYKQVIKPQESSFELNVLKCIKKPVELFGWFFIFNLTRMREFYFFVKREPKQQKKDRLSLMGISLGLTGKL